MTKILAIDGSPSGEKGNTALLLDRFLAGTADAGAEVQRVSAYKMRVERCSSRMRCWYSTRGSCIHKDDMLELLDRMADADCWVLSTPVHVGGMTEGMVRVMERTMPLLSPYFEVRDGRTRHVVAPGAEQKLTVLVSTCGLYEEAALGPLVSQVADFSQSHNRRFAGALIRPHGLALKFMQANGYDVDDVLNAAHAAGAELVRTGTMSEDTLRKVRKPLMTQEEFVQMMNSAFDRRLGCQAGRQSGR